MFAIILGMAGTLTKIKLITFDAYNTLFKLNKNPAKIYANEACHYGIHVPSKSIESSFGRVYKEQLRQKPFYGLHQGLSPSDWWKETVYKTFLGAGVSKQKLDPIYDPLFNSLFNCFTLRKYYLLYPDVTPTLELLKQYGFKIGVISNTDERIVSLMQNLNIDKYFDFIVSGVQVGSEKPSTEIFDRARCLSPKSIQPEEVLHVGDDEERDYQGAINAGEHAVLLHRDKLECEYTPIDPERIEQERHSYKNIVSLNELMPFLLNNFKIK